MSTETTASEPVAADRVEPDLKQNIAIVGGGIAGLLCAYVLVNEGHCVDLFESSDVLGGRIRSLRFHPTMLNDLERLTDENRQPVKDEAILSKALLPELIKPLGSTPTAPSGEHDGRHIPSPENPLYLTRTPKHAGGKQSDPRPDKANKSPEKVGADRFFTADDYDKRQWDHLEFNAEFGPMRIELEVQRLLDLLLKKLEIPGLNDGPPDEVGNALDLVRMQRFPPFSSPASAGDPVYDLNPEEEGKNPLELLKLGVCRAVVDLYFEATDASLDDAAESTKRREPVDRLEKKKIEDFEKSRDILLKKLNNAAATQRPAGPIFESWVRNHLHEDDYWVIQRYGQIPVLYGAERYIPLHTMGFWNLMAAYLSHNAMTKVRDLGAFYHLIPENPNAGEWLAWWVRQISISGHLEGIFGGMQSVTEKLTDAMKVSLDPANELRRINPGRTLVIHLKSTVTKLTKRGSRIAVEVSTKKDGKTAVKTARHLDNGDDKYFDRVILALPTVPAEKLTQSSDLWRDAAYDDDNKTRFTDYLDSALPFQLLKAFFVVRERWWEEDVRANPGVTRYPTREVYFWKSRMKDSRRGLVMLYTDRPAAAFWANYVPGPVQDDIDELCRPDKTLEAEVDAVETMRARMKSRFVEYVNDNEGQKITPEDIIWCGIMDWGREPYGAASHAWRPNREYWNTLAELAEWPIKDDDGTALIHVCGEAYSDYHAFIEGALRSALHVLTKIPNKTGATKADRVFDILQTQLGAHLTVASINKAIDSDAVADATAAAELKDPTKGPQIKLVGNDKYVKDFIDWSTKLDAIAAELRGTS